MAREDKIIMNHCIEFAKWKDENFWTAIEQEKPYLPKITSEYFSMSRLTRWDRQERYTIEQLYEMWSKNKQNETLEVANW